MISSLGTAGISEPGLSQEQTKAFRADQASQDCKLLLEDDFILATI